MKTLLLLLFVISMMIMVGAEKKLGKQQRGILNAVSGRSSRRTEREEKINKGFEWIVQGVNILDQVDNFISGRTKDIIRKLHAAYNEDDRNAYKNFDHNFKKNY